MSKLVIALAGALLVTAIASPSDVMPPVAAKKEKKVEVHGESFADPFFWFREKSNPEVISYLESENAYTSAVMKPAEAFQETLYKEMLGRIKQTDLSVPYLYRGFYYYTRTQEGKQYPYYCRKKGSLDAPEEILIDQNELAEGQKFLSIGALEVSDDGTLLAYSTDNTGFRQYTLYVKDLRTGAVYADKIEKTTSVVWAADNRTLFYIVEDPAKRSYRLYRHVLGGKNDDLMYEEKDELYSIGVRRSRSGDYIFLGSSSAETTEFFYLPAADPKANLKLILAREEGHEYYPDHRGDLFYIRTNEGAKNFRVVTAPVADPKKANWKEVIPHNKDVMIAGFSLFADQAVISEREDGLPRLAILDFKTGKTTRMTFPEPIFQSSLDTNREFDTRVVRYRYQSFITPPSVYDFDIDSGKTTLLKETEVLGGYDRNRYATERIYATASDGTRLPISLLYLKGTKRDGKTPALVYGYGSYGSPQFVSFNSNRFSLVDRGMIFALAHIRGGGELGDAWHDAGKMMKKKNTFTDFIAIAEHLIKQKYTSKDHLAIQGGSAGGLLMGAVVNMRPDLFKVVVSNVPFVDVVNTMLDATLPLTVGEYIEWGNPNKKDEYAYIKSYDPYTNLAAKKYPAMLVTTSLNDSQVMYWEATKYVAKLRSLKTDENTLLLRTNMAAGHGGSSGRYDRLKEIAADYAFMLWQLGITK